MRSKPKVVSLKHRELLAELSFLGQPTGWDLNLDPLHYSGPAERAGGEAWLAGGAGAEVAAGQEDDVALPFHADDALRGLEGFHRSGRLGVLGSRGCARLLLRGAGCGGGSWRQWWRCAGARTLLATTWRVVQGRTRQQPAPRRRRRRAHPRLPRTPSRPLRWKPSSPRSASSAWSGSATSSSCPAATSAPAPPASQASLPVHCNAEGQDLSPNRLVGLGSSTLPTIP